MNENKNIAKNNLTESVKVVGVEARVMRFLRELNETS